MTWTFTTTTWTWRANLSMALIDPINRIGSPGKDLLSRNCNWSLPLLGLPGRAGMDLGLALSLNSLIYTRAGSVMHFDPDQGDLGPGFRLGFPEIRNAFTNTDAGVQSYLLSMPSGSRVEFRQISMNVYEAVDSSYMLLTHDPVNSVFILRTTDGTQFRFEDVTGLGDYKCVQIKDRQGNYITITYGSLAEIRTVIDNVGRLVNFNYDGSNHLLSITQNWGGQTHTWATFAYGTQTIQTNFPGLTLNGTTNGEPESVLLRVGLADGTVYSFEYNTYAQVKTMRKYAPKDSNPVNFPGDYVERFYTTYGLPDNATDPQTDCPRATSRADGAADWHSDVKHFYDGDPGHAWGQVTFPDGTIYKEFFATTGWQRGLTTQTENWTGGMTNVKKKWTALQWTQDNTEVSYRLNPRVTETNVYDEAGNRRRTTMSYTSFGLPSDVYEYDANATTVLRRTQTDYNLSAVYIDRRIIGLPSAVYLKDGNNTLFSKVTFEYDQNPNPYLQHQGPPVQHDTANYGPGFVQGRGNLNIVRRWDVTDPDKASENETGYNTSGSVIFTRDPLDHQTSISYADSFSDGQNNRNTYAYPTTMTDADNFSSTIQYNFYFGAVTRTQNPKGAAVTRTYDAAGRIDRQTNVVNGAYTRYFYAPNQSYVQSFTTINDLGSEFYSIRVFDGHDRVRGTASDHPTSVGQYKAQNNGYDVMGRLAQQTNPTEINVNWIPAGDDAAAGWVWTTQAYDWQGQPTVTTNQDETTKEFLYGGCGCAGGQVVVTRDEVGRRQKIYSDVLGRVIKTEDLLSDGGVYRTTTKKYNVRDQVEEVKSIAGSAGAFQVAANEYDGHGRLWRRKLPIEGASSLGTRFTYNSDDTVNTATDPRNVVSIYTYNARKLVTGVSFNTGGNPDIAGYGPISLTYDENGNRLTMTDGTGNTTYHYDSLSRMDWERRYFNDLSQGYYIYYTYNLAGQVKEIKDHFDDVIYYNLDKAGQVVSVTGADLTSGQQFQVTSSQPVSQITYRAWGGLKHMTSGNGVKTNITYDQAMRIKLFEVTDVLREPGYPDQSSLGMKSEHEYYGDNRPKYVKDYKDDAFDRAYKWDHVGRLEDAYTGPEARGFAGKGPPTTNRGPYRQIYQHDEWGNMTTRVADFWSKTDTLSASFSPETGRNPNWSYDASGNLTQDNNRKYLYDAAGFNWQSQNLSGVPEVAQSRDGDGNAVKRNSNLYYLNSTVLGGLPLTQIYDIREYNGQIIKGEENVYFGGERIAILLDHTTGAWNPPEIYVMYDHVNPVTGSNGRSNEIGWYYREAELDPMGVNFGFEDPFVEPAPPPDPDMERGIPSLFLGPGETGKRCDLDGAIVDCGFVIPLHQSGSVVFAPTATVKSVYNPFSRRNELAIWKAHADGYSGYLPVSARYNGDGTWNWKIPTGWRPLPGEWRHIGGGYGQYGEADGAFKHSSGQGGTGLLPVSAKVDHLGGLSTEDKKRVDNLLNKFVNTQACLDAFKNNINKDLRGMLTGSGDKIRIGDFDIFLNPNNRGNLLTNRMGLSSAGVNYVSQNWAYARRRVNEWAIARPQWLAQGSIPTVILGESAVDSSNHHLAYTLLHALIHVAGYTSNGKNKGNFWGDNFYPGKGPHDLNHVPGYDAILNACYPFKIGGPDWYGVP